ncbi:M50 family metallopeptidase [Niallia sp. NCCP-28]|uniref:M50 family metallopeptidase n=1 Tax=Niallia sp. NCCP-28 TaxID=2934712 RepID=UPI00208BBB33|nr:M50 family metallopeptidase [Niallia sp. NCCP-28]GKU81430.1 stage IV sporulation protein FB [Niallia sp. NCCP-28]
MNKFFRVFKYFHIHPLLWVVMAIGVMTAHFYDLCLLLFIITVHELGHAVAASFFSWRIKRISLLPFGGVAEMDEHGNRPLKEEVIVILAGPAQHIWMMILAYFLYENGYLSASIYEVFISYNMIIFLFNLLPIWPLDGGKLLFLYISMKKAFPIAHKMMLLTSVAGVILFTLFVILFMPINLNAWIIICFLLFSIYYEWKQSRYVFMRFLLERYYGKSKELRQLKPIEVDEGEMIFRVLEHFHRGCKHPIVITTEGKEKQVLDENEVLHAYFTDKLVSVKIGDIVYPV